MSHNEEVNLIKALFSYEFIILLFLNLPHLPNLPNVEEILLVFFETQISNI